MSIGAKKWDDVWVLGVVKQPQTTFFALEQNLAPVFRSTSIGAEGLAHNYNWCILQSLVRSGFKGTRWNLQDRLPYEDKSLGVTGGLQAGPRRRNRPISVAPLLE